MASSDHDPRLARAAASSLYAIIARRIRWGVVAFVLGFLMLMAFAVSVAVALAGFGTMLAAALFIYQQLRRLGRDHVRGPRDDDRFPLTAFLARMAERFRGRRDTGGLLSADNRKDASTRPPEGPSPAGGVCV